MGKPEKKNKKTVDSLWLLQHRKGRISCKRHKTARGNIGNISFSLSLSLDAGHATLRVFPKEPLGGTSGASGWYL